MKRRELLKTGLATLAGAAALSGCSKTDNTSSFDDIIPKQTATYEFSAPLPFDFKTIDEMAEINSGIKKSQVTSLYNNLPRPLVKEQFKNWVHLVRGKKNYDIKTIDDFGQYVKYAMDKGFDFTYLMNSAKVFTERDFLSFKDNFLYLLEYLHKIGVKNIKVSTNQVIDLINKYAPNEFNLQISICFCLHHLSQYRYLFDLYPNFNLINISRDESQNFELFRNLRKLYPDKKIELMIREGCTKGCPGRLIHCQEPDFCKLSCDKMREEISIMHYFVKSGSIFPWDMGYYSSVGINHFKYTTAPPDRSDYRDLAPLKKMLTIIENGYENYTWKDLFDAGWIYPYMYNEKNKNVKLADVAPLFPSMKHFIKNGDKCVVRCETQCNYCYDCSKKLDKALFLS